MSIREGYEKLGVEGFYARHGANYVNPHEAEVAEAISEAHKLWDLPLHGKVLDLACGSGEATRALQRLGARNVSGADPYTSEVYRARVGGPVAVLGFEDIARGAACAWGPYSLVVCSYALHLLEKSWLPGLFYELSRITSGLLIVSPHKRPTVKQSWGWRLHEHELRCNNVHVRLYKRA
jgi:hypothetical protein